MNDTYLDCLAELGVGGAHPGGLPLTQKILSDENIQPSMSILDAGCGTGRTSAYIYEHFGCQVTAIDNHKTMVKKAKQRFLTQNLPIEVTEGSTEKLPYDTGTFDIVLSESVIAFTDTKLTLPEFKRVIKPNGILLAVEMVLEKELPQVDLQVITDFYRINQLLTAREWDSLFERVGFKSRSMNSFTLEFDKNDLVHAPEFLLSENLPDLYFNKLQEHEELTQKYKDVLGYRIFRCTV